MSRSLMAIAQPFRSEAKGARLGLRVALSRSTPKSGQKGLCGKPHWVNVGQGLLLGQPEVMCGLHFQPDFGVGASPGGKTQGHVCGDAGFAVESSSEVKPLLYCPLSRYEFGCPNDFWGRALFRSPQIIVHLHAEPEFGAAATIRAEPGFDAPCHFGRYGGVTIQYAG